MEMTFQEHMAGLDPARRAAIEAGSKRLYAEYLTMQELRKAKQQTQAQLVASLGLRQETVARYEQQSDLLLATLANYIRALGGSFKMQVEFPGRQRITIERLGDTEDLRPDYFYGEEWQCAPPNRRKAGEAGKTDGADRLRAEYLAMQELRKAKKLMQVQLLESLGLQQMTLARYERQNDLLLATLGGQVRALGGSFNLLVEFPGKGAVTLESLADTEKPLPEQRGKGPKFVGRRQPGRRRAAGEAHRQLAGTA